MVGFSDEQIADLTSTLTRWSVEDSLGREIVRNINPLERFLPTPDMRSLLIALMKSYDKPLVNVADGYARECHQHVRAGGLVHEDAVTIVGRAVHRESFVQWLWDAEGSYFHTEANVNDFIDRLAQGESPEGYERSILMSRFSAWVTWDLSAAQQQPFGFVHRSSAREVRAFLGLDSARIWSGKSLLLLTYRCRPQLALFRPTIADAGLHRFFEPPQAPFDQHGWTKTWPEGLCEPDILPRPRPEAVHAPAPFELLIGPIRQLW